jgi:hypothetical protein
MAEEVFKNVQVLNGIPRTGRVAWIADGAADQHHQFRRSSGGHLLFLSSRPAPPKSHAEPGGVVLRATDEPDDAITPAPNAPPADQIFESMYLTAIGGGATRIAALRRYTATGTYQATTDAEPRPLEVSVRAPNQRLWVWHTAYGDHAMAFFFFYERSRWLDYRSQAERPLPVETLIGQELDGTRFEVELTFPTRIKQALTQVHVGFPQSIDDREMQVVQGGRLPGAW